MSIFRHSRMPSYPKADEALKAPKLHKYRMELSFCSCHAQEIICNAFSFQRVPHEEYVPSVFTIASAKQLNMLPAIAN